MKQGFALAGTCFLISIAAFLAYVWMNAERLPERVATDFTMQGEPETWMSRGEHLTFMTGMGIGVPFSVVGMFLLIRRVPARFVRLPYRDYWLAEERRSSTSGWMTRSALWLGCGFTVGMGMLHELILRANQQTPATLDSGPVLLVVALMMACAVAFVIATVLHFHKPPGA